MVSHLVRAEELHPVAEVGGGQLLQLLSPHLEGGRSDGPTDQVHAVAIYVVIRLSPEPAYLISPFFLVQVSVLAVVRAGLGEGRG